MKMACLNFPWFVLFFGPAKGFFTKILARQAFLFQILAREQKKLDQFLNNVHFFEVPRLVVVLRF
jgi:hypothetical protein